MKYNKYNTPLPLFDSVEYLEKNILPPILFEGLEIDDYKHAREFLLAYRGSVDTFNEYRREVERLFQWCLMVVLRPLKQLNRTDIEEYISFCIRPPRSWIALKRMPRFIDQKNHRVPNSRWRPFVVTLPKAMTYQGIEPKKSDFKFTRTAVKQLFVILSSFFKYLVAIEYLQKNPFDTILHKSRYLPSIKSESPIRRLSEIQWNAVLTTARHMAKESPNIHERTLFVIVALYTMYLRISELVVTSRWEPTMNDFHKDRDNSWWFKTIGKGNKHRNIAVSDDMLAALKRYRIHLELSELPSPKDESPLLRNISGKHALKSVRTIRNIVQQCINRAIDYLAAKNELVEATGLPEVTVHWFRHTGISDDVMRRPREHVRDDAGHSSIAITDKYIDIELKKRHASAKTKSVEGY